MNLPYQSDIVWWFKEVQRREGVAGDGAGKLVKVLNSYVPKSQKEEVLQNDVGLFTGETLIHIAIQRSLHVTHTHAHTHAHTQCYPKVFTTLQVSCVQVLSKGLDISASVCVPRARVYSDVDVYTEGQSARRGCIFGGGEREILMCV